MCVYVCVWVCGCLLLVCDCDLCGSYVALFPLFVNILSIVFIRWRLLDHFPWPFPVATRCSNLCVVYD